MSSSIYLPIAQIMCVSFIVFCVSNIGKIGKYSQRERVQLGQSFRADNDSYTIHFVGSMSDIDTQHTLR